MSGVVRLGLVSHAMTDAIRAGRFPSDEPLNDRGRRDAERSRASGMNRSTSERVVSGPEQRALQTAAALGPASEVDTALRDLDCGAWLGLTTDQVPSPQLGIWLQDPTARPHGGETITELVHRVGEWMGQLVSVDGRVLAITHPAVVRAAVLIALNAPIQSFWRIDVAPLSRITLHGRGTTWSLRSTPG